MKKFFTVLSVFTILSVAGITSAYAADLQTTKSHDCCAHVEKTCCNHTCNCECCNKTK